MTKLNMDAVLCYVEEPWAYFTTRPIEDQWGDDWDDMPYEFNAGLPYNDRKPGFAGDDWKPAWEITVVAFTGPFSTPGSSARSSRYSVQDINEGAVPWLREVAWRLPVNNEAVKINAGTTLRDFIKAVESVNGVIYTPLDK